MDDVLLTPDFAVDSRRPDMLPDRLFGGDTPLHLRVHVHVDLGG